MAMEKLDDLEVIVFDGTDDAPVDFAAAFKKLVGSGLVHRDQQGEWTLTEVGRAVLEQQNAATH